MSFGGFAACTFIASVLDCMQDNSDDTLSELVDLPSHQVTDYGQISAAEAEMLWRFLMSVIEATLLASLIAVFLSLFFTDGGCVEVESWEWSELQMSW